MTEKNKNKKKVNTLTKERVDLQKLSKILSGGLSVAGQSAGVGSHRGLTRHGKAAGQDLG